MACASVCAQVRAGAAGRRAAAAAARALDPARGTPTSASTAGAPRSLPIIPCTHPSCAPLQDLSALLDDNRGGFAEGEATFSVEGRLLRAPKGVLCARCPHFRAMCGAEATHQRTAPFRAVRVHFSARGLCACGQVRLGHARIPVGGGGARGPRRRLRGAPTTPCTRPLLPPLPSSSLGRTLPTIPWPHPSYHPLGRTLATIPCRPTARCSTICSATS